MPRLYYLYSRRPGFEPVELGESLTISECNKLIKQDREHRAREGRVSVEYTKERMD